MKKYLLLLSIMALSSLFLFSCTQGQLGSTIGGLGGAAIGGQVGSKHDRLRNAAIGALAGTVIGYIVGNEMDKNDRQQLTNTFETQPSHKRVEWVNPDNGNRYNVTPEPAYRGSNNRDCRDAYVEAVIGGEYKQVKTTACRNYDGTWEIVK